MSSGRRHRRTMRVFHATYGDPPWNCFFCRTTVLKLGQGTWDGNVHHLDNDETNDVPENIVPAHTVCHLRHHGVSLEARQKISLKLKGRPSPTRGMKFSPEVNARKGRHGTENGMFGRSATKAMKDAVSQANRRKTDCPTCGQSVAVHWLSRHRQAGCRPSRMIQINGVSRVRGKEPKITCTDCGKPYGQRWMQRHKDEGRCTQLST